MLVPTAQLSTRYLRSQFVLKVCNFLLHPKANIKVMAGLLLPPNELKLISLNSSDVHSHSLSPPANLLVGQSHVFSSAAGDWAGLVACNRSGTGAQQKGKMVASLMLMVVPV